MKRKAGTEAAEGTTAGREGAACRVDPAANVAKQATPNYGAKEYWEARYKSHLPGAVPNKVEARGASAADDGDDAAPGHAWYFSYDELRPLILPLVLGDVDEDSENDSDLSHGEEGGSWTEDEEEGVTGEGECEVTDASGEDADEGHTLTTGDTGTADPKKGSPEEGGEAWKHALDLAMGGSDVTEVRPKRVLEVGCGDVPLGVSLAADLVAMQATTGIGATSVAAEITCIDYSEIVVQSLIDSQRKERAQEPSTSSKGDSEQRTRTEHELRPTFRALDARALPYAPNTYDLVLEKGTLDAMLSDSEEGLANCARIVKEMARVTSDGGAIFIVSHLNANEPKGMGWLEDVVFRGLKDEYRETHTKNGNAQGTDVSEEKDLERDYVWSVQVHGGAGQLRGVNGPAAEGEAEEGEAEEGEADEEEAPAFGPAVYIVRKKGVTAAVARELRSARQKKTGEGAEEQGDGASDEEGTTEMLPVKLEFLSYEDE